MSDVERIAEQFVREISDGWGEDVERKDIARLVELLRPMEQQIERLRREMRRHLEILERAERDRFLWDRLATGTGVATLNGYRAALEEKPRA
jgi:hypothetical protein